MVVKKAAPKPAEKKTGEGAKATKAAGPATVTLKQLAAELADSHDLQRKQAETLLSGVVDMVVAHLKGGDRIRLASLGILEVKERAARLGRNPATGEQIEIKASKKVAFRPAKELKEAI